MSVLPRFRMLGPIGRCLALWLARQREQREPRAREFDREQLLHDLGLAMSDMEVLARPTTATVALLTQRLGLVDLDPRYLEVGDPATWQDLQSKCVGCVNWRRCARDLAQLDVQSGLASYCPNGPLIDRLLIARDRP